MKPRYQRKKCLHAQTELLLYFLFDMLLTPLRRPMPHLLGTYNNLYEWDTLRRKVERLKKGGFIEEDKDGGTTLEKKVIRMTEKGRLTALGGIDPTVFWNSQWDGKWRVVSFDCPETMRRVRAELRKTLRHNHFGCLQRSLWVTPHNLGDELLGRGFDVESLENFVVMVADFHDRALPEDIVAEAWNFQKVEELYADHTYHLKKLPSSDAHISKLIEWAQMEIALWQKVVSEDPFLPRCLWPKKYCGEHSWVKRLAALKEIGYKLASRKTPIPHRK